MLIVTDRTKASSNTYYLTDGKDVADVVIGITGSEEEGKLASIVAAGLECGSTYSANKWRVSVVRE